MQTATPPLAAIKAPDVSLAAALLVAGSPWSDIEDAAVQARLAAACGAWVKLPPVAEAA